MADKEEEMVIVSAIFLGEKKQNKMSLMSTGHSGAPWQLFYFLIFRLPSVFPSFIFLIGYTPHLTVCKLVCPRGNTTHFWEIGPRQSNMLKILDWRSEHLNKTHTAGISPKSIRRAITITGVSLRLLEGQKLGKKMAQ